MAYTYRVEQWYRDKETEDITVSISWYAWRIALNDGGWPTHNHPGGLEDTRIEGSPRPLTLQETADVDALLQNWPFSSVREAVSCLTDPDYAEFLNSVPPVLEVHAHA